MDEISDYDNAPAAEFRHIRLTSTDGEVIRFDGKQPIADEVLDLATFQNDAFDLKQVQTRRNKAGEIVLELAIYREIDEYLHCGIAVMQAGDELVMSDGNTATVDEIADALDREASA